MIRYSVLDLAPIIAGGDAALAFRNMRDLAQHVEQWGYHRFWLAEHHNIPGVASAATSVLIGHVAGATLRMRVGSGGIMLPNHAPLLIAEQFGTLESLYPGRIDLGLGRAPGGDRPTAHALRRRMGSSGDTFPEDLQELRSYFAPPGAGQAVAAVPGAGLNVPIYLLGSSDFSARLAGELGLPFAFASHFAPDYLLHALALYRQNFRPSAQLSEPYVIVGVNVVAADTDAEAARLFTSLQQMFLGMIRGRRSVLPPPVDTMDGEWSAMEAAHAQRMLHYSAVGSAETIGRRLESFIAETGADEIIATAQVYDHGARLRSFEIAAAVFEDLAQAGRPGHVPDLVVAR
jgi:luciferase family oxidoreductase group 1